MLLQAKTSRNYWKKQNLINFFSPRLTWPSLAWVVQDPSSAAATLSSSRTLLLPMSLLKRLMLLYALAGPRALRTSLRSVPGAHRVSFSKFLMPAWVVLQSAAVGEFLKQQEERGGLIACVCAGELSVFYCAYEWILFPSCFQLRLLLLVTALAKGRLSLLTPLWKKSLSKLVSLHRHIAVIPTLCDEFPWPFSCSFGSFSQDTLTARRGLSKMTKSWPVVLLGRPLNLRLLWLRSCRASKRGTALCLPCSSRSSLCCLILLTEGDDDPHWLVSVELITSQNFSNIFFWVLCGLIIEFPFAHASRDRDINPILNVVIILSPYSSPPYGRWDFLIIFPPLFTHLFSWWWIESC